MCTPLILPFDIPLRAVSPKSSAQNSIRNETKGSYGSQKWARQQIQAMNSHEKVPCVRRIDFDRAVPDEAANRAILEATMLRRQRCHNLLQKFDFVLRNKMMKEHLALPPSETSSIFYRQNEFNKPLSLPFFQFKDCHSVCNCYPQRRSRCFPTAAPISCLPMVHRTRFSDRPLSGDEVRIPTRDSLRKTYTIKLDKRFLRKEE